MGYTPPFAQAGQQITLLVYPAPASADGFHTAGAHTMILTLNTKLSPASAESSRRRRD